MENKGPVVAAGIILLLIAISAGGYFYSKSYISPSTDTAQGTYNPNVTPDPENSLYTLNNDGYYDENVIEFDQIGGLSIPGTITKVNNDGTFEFKSIDDRVNKTFSISFSDEIPVVITLLADQSDYPSMVQTWENFRLEQIGDYLIEGSKAILIKENISASDATNILENETDISLNKIIIFNQ